jgi:lambda repressor-like predicted transcriptional regulator
MPGALPKIRVLKMAANDNHNQSLQPMSQPVTWSRLSLLAEHDAGATWRKMAAKYGVAAGTLQRIATTDYEPQDHAIRAAVGMPPLPVPVVPCWCGKVHKRGHPSQSSRRARLYRRIQGIDGEGI